MIKNLILVLIVRCPYTTYISISLLISLKDYYSQITNNRDKRVTSRFLRRPHVVRIWGFGNKSDEYSRICFC